MGADTSGRLLRRVNALVRFDMADSEIRSSSKYDNGAFRRGRELIYNFTHAMCEILVFFFFFGIWSLFAIGSVFESRVVGRSRKECKINRNVQYQISIRS